MDVNTVEIDGATFYKDNILVKKEKGITYLTYFIEDDFFVTVLSKEKVKEIIAILGK